MPTSSGVPHPYNSFTYGYGTYGTDLPLNEEGPCYGTSTVTDEPTPCTDT